MARNVLQTQVFTTVKRNCLQNVCSYLRDVIKISQVIRGGISEK